MDDHVKRLMEAEGQANQIVEKANQEKCVFVPWVTLSNRASRLESARFEAKKEINKYREEEERKFKDYVDKAWLFSEAEAENNQWSK